MMEKYLKYLNLKYDPELRRLELWGENKFVKGYISISYSYLYSILVFINRIFRKRKWK